MPKLSPTLWLCLVACATASPPVVGPVPEPVPAPATMPVAEATTQTGTVAVFGSDAAPLALASEASCTETATAAFEAPFVDEGADAEIADGALEELEAAEIGSVDPNRIRYTTELSDEALGALWRHHLEALGSISVGFAHEGRLINGRRLPEDPTGTYQVVTPWSAFGTDETLEAIARAAARVKAEYPDALPLRVNQISAPEGGYLRPHRSHQNGRDVDLGFYYPISPPPRVREREKVIDVGQNWSLIKALAIETDVQVILLDRRVQAVIYNYALEHGEDRAWLDNLFRSGPASLVQHAPGHRDHLHARFYNPRAQELGRRVAPLLAQRPEQNVAAVRIRNGDTLSHLAVRYNSSIRAIQSANRLKGSFIRIGQVLRVPMRGPCNRCPVPPGFEIPPRRLPPSVELAGRLLPTATGTTATATRTQTFSSLR